MKDILYVIMIIIWGAICFYEGRISIKQFPYRITKDSDISVRIEVEKEESAVHYYFLKLDGGSYFGDKKDNNKITAVDIMKKEGK